MNSHHQGHHDANRDNGSLQPHNGAAVYAAPDDTAVYLHAGHDDRRDVDVDQGEGSGDLHVASAELEHGSGVLVREETENAETAEGCDGASDSNAGVAGHGVLDRHADDMADDDADGGAHRDSRSDLDIPVQGADAVPTSNTAVDGTSQTVPGMGDHSGGGAAVSSTADLEERLVISPAESWLRNIPKGASNQAAYTQAAVASLLGRLTAAERVLSDTCRTVAEIVGNVNGIVGFINGMTQNKELLLAMMQNATMVYNELERSVLQESYRLKHDFSLEESDGHDLRLSILETDGQPSPKVEIRNNDGTWTEDARGEIEAVTAHYLMLQDAMKAGYEIGSVVYVKTTVDGTPEEV